MCIIGEFSDFSLVEVFQLIDHGDRTGLLTVQSRQGQHYFWTQQGSIVAASDRQDGWGLYSLIIQMKFLLPPTLERLIQCIYDPSQPLGECLYEKGVLSLANLEFLFQLQLTREFYAVTDNSNTRFSIDTDITIPNFELTGLSLPLICLTGSDESLASCTATLKSNPNPFCFWSQGLIKNKVPNVLDDNNSYPDHAKLVAIS